MFMYSYINYFQSVLLLRHWCVSLMQRLWKISKKKNNWLWEYIFRIFLATCNISIHFSCYSNCHSNGVWFHMILKLRKSKPRLELCQDNNDILPVVCWIHNIFLLFLPISWIWIMKTPTMIHFTQKKF